jgi:hypothetical protein
VSKRHQSNRRKNYGRRQHEVSERRQRDQQTAEMELGLDDLSSLGMGEHFSFLDPRAQRMHFALGD